MDPITLAVTASLAGTAMSAVGMVSQAGQAKATADYNAKMAQREAVIASHTGHMEERRARRKAARIVGEQQAQFAAGGVNPYEGTPMALAEESLFESALDAEIINADATNRMQGLRSQADMFSQSGKNAWQAGMLGAGTTLLTGAAQAATMGGPTATRSSSLSPSYNKIRTGKLNPAQALQMRGNFGRTGRIGR